MAETAQLSRAITGYLKPEDAAQVEAAYLLARSAHEGQFRKSGEPYITHPVAVAEILAEMRLDPQALMAALLHDTVEDTGTTQREINRAFGKPVGDLVDGVSKLDKLQFASQQHEQAENFRKMLLAMARDVRVILIKLADRLHNMRTLDAVDLDSKKRIARETLEIYAPIANRLGLNSIYQELQELAFKYLYPTRFRVLSKAVKAARGNRREVISKIKGVIEERLKAFKMEALVTGREKHLYSIYKKMQEKSLSFAQVLDIYGFRVVVKDIPSCYLALGALHTLYKPIPGKFKDYIGIPKSNGYQAVHTALIGPFGTPIEIQIRTEEMHRVAEAGVASHWLYKSTDVSMNELQQKTHQLLQSLLEIQTQSRDSAEFLENVKVDLFPDEVYVFTPRGEIKSLPRGATAVDFAYAVHTDIGDRCVATKINSELAPLRTPLRSGDRVEIITAAHAAPNPAWLNFVVSGKARSHIRHYLKTMRYEESVQLGERLLDQALRALKVDPAEVTDGKWDQMLRTDKGKSREEVLADIGLGRRLNVVVARRLMQLSDSTTADGKQLGSIIIRGSDGMAVQFAQCCTPIPGDPIIGFINKGQGLTIHTHDCHQVRDYRAEPDKWVDVEWEAPGDRVFNVGIRVSAANRTGVLAHIAAAIAGADANIEDFRTDEKESSVYTAMSFTIQVRDRNHLAGVLQNIRSIPDVVRTARMKAAER